MSIEKTIGDWTQCWPAIHRGNDALAPSVMETALNFSYWLSCVAVATRRARQVASRSPWCFGRQRLLASSDLVHGQLDSGSPVSIQRTVCCLLSRRVLRVHPAERVDVDAVRASDCLSNVNNAARFSLRPLSTAPPVACPIRAVALSSSDPSVPARPSSPSTPSPFPPSALDPSKNPSLVEPLSPLPPFLVSTPALTGPRLPQRCHRRSTRDLAVNAKTQPS
ncbi:hypothetical protein VTN96DRAFT_1341 [Rasamsonia emersonii]